MLRNRAAAPGYFTGSQHHDAGAEDAEIVDARMFEVAAIFGSNESMHDEGWQVFISDKNAPPLSNFFNKTPVAAENTQWNLQRDLTNGFCWWQTRRHVVIRANQAGGDHQRHDQPHAAAQYEPRRKTCCSRYFGLLARVAGVLHGHGRIRPMWSS